MDGQNRKKGSYEAIAMGDQKAKTSGTNEAEEMSEKIDVYDNIEEPFDEEFWRKVFDLFITLT